MGTINRKTQQALICLMYSKYKRMKESSKLGEIVASKDFVEVFNKWKALLFEKMAKIDSSAIYLKSQAFTEVIQAIRLSRQNNFAVSSLSVAQDATIFLLQKFSEFMGDGLIEFSEKTINRIQREVQKMLGVAFTK